MMAGLVIDDNGGASPEQTLKNVVEALRHCSHKLSAADFWIRQYDGNSTSANALSAEARELATKAWELAMHARLYYGDVEGYESDEPSRGHLVPCGVCLKLVAKDALVEHQQAHYASPR